MTDNDLREKLAALAHEQWSGWMKYLFDCGTFNKDGTWSMDDWAVKRWTRQMNTAYDELPEDERESDRTEADKVLALLPNLNIDDDRLMIGPNYD